MNKVNNGHHYFDFRLFIFVLNSFMSICSTNERIVKRWLYYCVICTSWQSILRLGKSLIQSTAVHLAINEEFPTVSSCLISAQDTGGTSRRGPHAVEVLSLEFSQPLHSGEKDDLPTKLSHHAYESSKTIFDTFQFAFS